MAEEVDIQEMVRYIVTALVDNPDDVSIEERESDGQVSYEITVHDDDIGKIIGRQGRIIKAIRVLARAGGLMDGKQVYVDVLG
jgi:predicted RNA-binding protein YlqC (UPF0109 family)